MKDIHDRMPVILTHDQEKWLNPLNTDPDDLQSLLMPYDADDMEAYQVSPLVNSPKIIHLSFSMHRIVCSDEATIIRLCKSFVS